MTSKILRADGVTELASIQTVTYHESVNADIDLRPGCVASNYIEVTCFGAQSDAPDVGEALTYYQVVGGTETLIGTFYAEPSIPTKNSYSFIAYDAVHKLDADFSAWLSAHQDDFPYTVKQLVEQACTISGVMLGTSAWDHSTMEVNAWYADGLTCRNILQYAAEIACKFVRCNTDGEIVFDWYKGAASGDTKTASGTIATFDDGADRVPLKSLTAQITPAQDLHGYSNPWPAGGGKNKLPIPTSAVTDHGITATPNADGTITLTGTATGTQAYIDLDTNFNSSLYAGYILTGLPSSESWNQASVCIRISNQDSRASIQDITRVNGTYISNVITDNGDNLRISIRINAGYACPSEGVKLDLMLRAPTESSTFAPYSNICPISGWTGLEGKRTGKNLCGDVTVPQTAPNANRIVNPVYLKAGQYTFSFSGRSAVTAIYIRKGENITFAGDAYAHKYNSNVFTFTADEDGYYYVQLYRGGATPTWEDEPITHAWLELGSTASDYEPYQGSALSVSWQDTAGTVYGGKMTVNEDGSGDLVVELTNVDMGTLAWTANGSGDTKFFQSTAFDVKSSTINAICSQYKYVAIAISNTAQGFNINGQRCRLRNAAYIDSTAAEFKAAMSGVQLVYELATPLTYHFDNLEQLTTLIGTNNIWATTGDVEVEYYPTLGRIYPSSGTDDSGDRFAYKQDGLTYDNYDTSAVARVAVHPVGEDEVAYYYPTNVTSGNTLNITNNALLYGASSTDMLSIAQSIYTTMTALGTYRPMTVEMFPNECPFRTGYIVPVTDAQGVSFTTAVMEKTVTDSEVTLTSTGREVYGDYALDTAKQLVQLAADIVRINKLKVGWAEIDQAVVGVLTSEGIMDEIDGANKEEQLIYKTVASGTSSVSPTTTWITNTADQPNTWTKKRPSYDANYPVLFVATQRKAVDGTITCTTPLKDDNSTTISGGQITTGTIDASRVNVTNINASNINTGALTVRDASNNIIFQADASNKNVQVGGWYANKDYIYSSNSNTDINSLYVGRGQIIFKDPNGNAKKDIVIDASKEYVSGKCQNRIDTALYDVYEDDSSVSSKYSIGCVINDLYAPHFSIGSHFDGSNITSDIYFDADTVTIMNPSAWRTALGLDIIPFKISTTVLSGSYIRYPVGSATDDRITANHIAIINPYYSTGFMNNYFFTGQCANGYANIYVRTSTGEKVAAGTTMNLAGIFVKT